MADNKTSTRQLLLETAGKLFAAHGFAGTSVKMIAEKSQQNIAAVNYHFGSKQNLFNEALKFVLEMVTKLDPIDKSMGQADIEGEFALFIDEITRFLLSPQTPRWYGELMVRAALDSSGGLEQDSLAILSPEFDYLENLASRYDKTIGRSAARRWAYSVVGQIFFYVLGRNMILLANGTASYSQEYIDAVARQVKESSLLWLKHRQET